MIKKSLVGSTKLDDQILFMETINKVMITPMTIAISNSLKELKGIKQNNTEKAKTTKNE
jgi:hypothetical protein